MGELARRRDARDLWISRGHLHAAVTGLLVAVVAAFAAGHSVGARSEAPEAAAQSAFVRSAGSEDLMALLARVDASDDLDGGVASLTFPDQLTTPIELSEADPIPAGSFTVEAGRFHTPRPARDIRDRLREAGMSAWVGVERVDGELEYRVGVGGFSGHAPAEEALLEVAGALAEVPDGASIQPVVVPLPGP